MTCPAYNLNIQTSVHYKHKGPSTARLACHVSKKNNFVLCIAADTITERARNIKHLNNEPNIKKKEKNFQTPEVLRLLSLNHCEQQSLPNNRLTFFTLHLPSNLSTLHYIQHNSTLQPSRILHCIRYVLIGSHNYT